MILNKDTKITDYTYKQTTLGMKIFVQSKADFDTLVASMIDKKVEFYTHRSSEEKIMKVVLRGLPQMDIDELKTHFATELNVRPLDIFLMKTKNENIHSALYLVHLNKNDIAFNDLLKIKAINHTIIKWAYYKPKYRGPTICNKCSCYGHGAINCNRTPHCLLCAGPHEAKNCALRTNENPSSLIYKCYNCSKINAPSNHRANDIKCPFRQKYLDIKNKASSRSNSNHQTTPHQTSIFHQPQPLLTPITQQTPTFNNNNNNNSNNRSSRNHQSPSYADQLKYGHQATHQNEDLFSINQLLSIFRSAVSRIKQCKTKLDQITVITSLLEYAI